jgi:putative ABC transport system permease protein
MNWTRLVRERLTHLTGNAMVDGDIVEEIAGDLAERFDEYRRNGASEEEAREHALQEIADAEDLAARLRMARVADARRPDPPPLSGPSRLLEALWQDVCYAARALRHSPGFLLASVLTLAIGIGAVSAIASVFEAVLLEPVPYPNPDRLMAVWETDRDSGTVREPASIPDLIDFRASARQFDAFGGLIADELTFAPAGGDPVRLASLEVTADTLPLLGVDALAGRLFTSAEYRTGASSVLISERFWQRQFGRDRGALGRAILLDDQPHTIVGIVPETADLGVLQWLAAADYGRGFADQDARSRVDAWTVLVPDQAALPRDTHPALVIGRMVEGASLHAAQDEMTTIMSSLERAYPVNKARGVHVEPLVSVIFGPVRPALRVLLVAVCLVLLLAAANVANLVLVRGRGRLRDAAVRTALGATLPRLMRQFVIENLLVGLAAAVAGLAVAALTVRVLVAIAPPDVPRLAGATIDGPLLAFAFAIATLVAASFGLIPVLQARRLDVTAALSGEAGRTSTDSQSALRTRGLIIAVEVALGLVLTVGAGLMVRTLARLEGVDPGFRPDGVLKVEFQLPASRYPRDFKQWPNFVEVHRFNQALADAVAGLPGVQAVALAGNHPLDAGFTNSFTVVGREAEGRSWPEIAIRRVTPGYFRALRVPLVRGRLIAAGDSTTGPAVVLLNEAAAARFFGGRDPIGQQVQFWGSARSVIGIIGNERFHGVTEAPPPAVYAPLAQTPSATGAEVLLVRAESSPETLSGPVRRAIGRLDPGLSVFGVEGLQATLDESLGRRRFVMLLLTLFAVASLALATIGIYAVLSYDVVARRRELGIRAALGASATTLVGDVMVRAIRPMLIGLVAGTAAALALGRLLASLLYGIQPTDAWSFLTALALLTAVALMAGLAPAHRAIRMDPAATLRQD